MSKKHVLNAIEVKSPCSENWDEMTGSDKVRFCSHCSHTVNNISQMTRKEALRLVRTSEGRLCFRYIPDPNTNRPLFANNLYKITRRAPGLAAGVMTASITLATAAYAQEADIRNTDGPAVVAEKTLTPLVNEPEFPYPNETSPNIYGVIMDQNAAVIPGYPVALIDERSGEEIKTRSDEEGVYRFTNVPNGSYKLVFEGNSGFRQKSFPGISVSPQDNIRHNVTLEVGLIMGGGIAVQEAPLRHALSMAVEDDDLERVKDLITRHADVNAKEKDRDGITPLFIAVENGNTEIVEVLLRFGAKVNARNKNRETPLMMVDDDTPLELVELLLKYGAKVDLEDNEGNTALLRAADMSADISIIKALIHAGADVNHKNRDGDTAWDLSGVDEVERLLESVGGRSGDPKETDDDPEGQIDAARSN